MARGNKKQSVLKWEAERRSFSLAQLLCAIREMAVKGFWGMTEERKETSVEKAICC